MFKTLLGNLGYYTGADGASAFANSKAQTLFHGNRGKQLHFESNCVARHYHFFVGRKFNFAGDVSRAEVELRLVTLEEGGVAATFFFGKHVDFSVKLGVRSN